MATTKKTAAKAPSAKTAAKAQPKDGHSACVVGCTFTANAVNPTPYMVDAIQALARAAEANARAIESCASSLKSAPGTTANMLHVGA